VTMVAEVEVMLLPAKDCQQPPAAGGVKGRFLPRLKDVSTGTLPLPF
jgi:hypothetical protein